jgi:hypothetical protein
MPPPELLDTYSLPQHDDTDRSKFMHLSSMLFTSILTVTTELCNQKGTGDDILGASSSSLDIEGSLAWHTDPDLQAAHHDRDVLPFSVMVGCLCHPVDAGVCTELLLLCWSLTTLTRLKLAEVL